MRSSWLIGLVVTLHALAIGGVMVMQGCETRRPTPAQEPPPAPVLPPRVEPVEPLPPRPVFQPPTPIEQAPALPPAAGQVYEVQNGDSLSKIAARFGVSARELAELNKIKDANHIRVGQKLVLPDYAKAGASAAKPAKSTAKPTAAKDGDAYVVQPGDALEKIARRHGTTVSALREANNLKSDKIMVGQKLAIPGAQAEAKEKTAEKKAGKSSSEAKADEPAPVPAVAAPVPPPAPLPAEPRLEAPEESSPMEYTVMEGDTVEKIARMYIIRKEDLMRINNLTEGQALRTGQKLKIPTGGM